MAAREALGGTITLVKANSHVALESGGKALHEASDVVAKHTWVFQILPAVDPPIPGLNETALGHDGQPVYWKPKEIIMGIQRERRMAEWRLRKSQGKHAANLTLNWKASLEI